MRSFLFPKGNERSMRGLDNPAGGRMIIPPLPSHLKLPTLSSIHRLTAPSRRRDSPLFPSLFPLRLLPYFSPTGTSGLKTRGEEERKMEKFFFSFWKTRRATFGVSKINLKKKLGDCGSCPAKAKRSGCVPRGQGPPPLSHTLVSQCLGRTRGTVGSQCLRARVNV